MTEIRLLEQATIDKIAAGEVVERPGSIVKELCENSIDAGAGAITVEIRDGGLSLIRVTDNGEGIDPDQIRTAFLRHATSKITKVDDLTCIRSFGFRGEALSSIAAVSRVELITKTRENLTGIRCKIEGGIETLFEEIGAPEGSTFLVRDLFYNTPARKKFLKSAQTEAGYISDFVSRLALSHPEISIKFMVNGTTKLSTSGSGTPAARNRRVMSRIRVRGFISVFPFVDIRFGSFRHIIRRQDRSEIVAQVIQPDRVLRGARGSGGRPSANPGAAIIQSKQWEFGRARKVLRHISPDCWLQIVRRSRARERPCAYGRPFRALARVP